LVDVGISGARISGITTSAAVGEKLRLTLFSRGRGALVIAARVAWARPPEVGVEFIRPSPVERLTIAALIEEARQRLATASEVAPPSFCRCLEDNVVGEPPLPRAAYREGSR